MRHFYCWHDWGKWSRPMATYNTGHKAQWRECKKCGLAKFRTLWWDKQVDAPQIGSYIDAALEAPPKG